MESLLKQRLVGAIVLVMLGVIFIPALLDGSGYKARNVRDIKIKKLPEFPSLNQNIVTPISVPFETPATKKQYNSGTEKKEAEKKERTEQKLNIPVQNKRPVAKVLPIQKHQNESNKKSNKKRLGQNLSSEKVALKEKVVSKNHALKTAVQKTASKKTTAKKSKVDTSTVFSLQVGTYSTKENAKKMQAKMKKLGYNSYIKIEKQARGKTSYKVRLGPEKSRAWLDKIKVGLKNKHKVDAYVVEHNN